MSCYRCTVRCQWRRQLWKVGETVECGGGEMPPSAFFEEIALEAPEVEPPQEEHVDELATKRRGGRKRKEEDGDDRPGGGEQGADTAGS